MNEFEWMEEVPTYITLQPNTIYHFIPNISSVELKNFITTINPSHVDVIEWLNDLFNDGWVDKRGFKYFVLGEDVEVQGWCSCLEIEEALMFRSKHSVVNVNVRNLPLSRPIVPNQG